MMMMIAVIMICIDKHRNEISPSSYLSFSTPAHSSQKATCSKTSSVRYRTYTQHNAPYTLNMPIALCYGVHYTSTSTAAHSSQKQLATKPRLQFSLQMGERQTRILPRIFYF